MKLALVRVGALLLIASLLQACGGDDKKGSGGNTAPSLSVNTTDVTVAAQPGDLGPTSTVQLNIANPPVGGVFVGTILSGSGIASLNLDSTIQTHQRLAISFQYPHGLEDGTYDGSVEVHVCTDASCAHEIAGSPVTIATSYVVSGGMTGTLDRNTVDVATTNHSEQEQEEVVHLTLDPAPAFPLYGYTEYTQDAVRSASTPILDTATMDVSISFKSGTSMLSGTHNDTVTLTLCYDGGCMRHVRGSPFTISTHMVVDVGAEPGYTPLAVASRIALAHDVLDAEFSKALNAVVMVGRYPVNALYVYDIATGTEQRRTLVKVPTAVSVSPDGLTAAVGHDAMISIVDLTTVGQPGAPGPKRLNVSIDVLDVVLDGRGRVHALPRTDQWQQIHTVDIATKAERLGAGGLLYAGALGRLHPSGNFLYTADNGLSPSDIRKWDVTGDHAVGLYDSPYHGDYAMCGNLWFNESGATIYTVCGNSFRSTGNQSTDMTYSGALELSLSDYYGWVIRSLSESDAGDEIALIEAELYQCDYITDSEGCYTHLALYESDFFTRRAVFAIGPVAVEGTTYAERGLFIFHDVTGSQKVMISRLEGMSNPKKEYYLSLID